MFKSNKEYDELNIITAFAREKTGIFEAEGFFDGSIVVEINKKYIDEKTNPKDTLQEHSAAITDLMFIVTHNYGVTIQENTPTTSRLFLASSSLDQTVIIWQLYEGSWSVAHRFEFENSYCTSISADLNNEKIYFAFSDGDAKYIDINDATKMNHIRKYDNAPICIAIDVNPSSSSYFSDNNDDETIITGNNNGEMKCSIGENTQIIKGVTSTHRILYIDIDSPYIVSTFEDGSIFITDKCLSQTSDVTPALVGLSEFKAIIAKFDKLTHAIKILSDKGKIVTVMKFPNNTYRLLK